MSLIHQILPWVGQLLLLSVLLTLLTGLFVKDTRLHKAVVIVLLILCLFIPVFGLSIGQWLRSVFGDLSVLTLIIFANILAQRLFNFKLLSPLSRQALLLGIVLLSVVFYPMALGLSAVDPYHFGYAPVGMSILLFSASIYAWFKGQRDLAIVLLMPLFAFNLRLLESANLWDYLLDPVLFGYAALQSALLIKFKIMRSRA